MKVSTENDNNFGYEKITIVVDNIPLNNICVSEINCSESIQVIVKMKIKHRIIGEYATKRCFFDLKNLTIVTGS
jgi:hypothetical protein